MARRADWRAVLEVLDNDTILLIVSDHGAQRSDGGFAINQWLIREGLLVLNEYPKSVTSFENLDVDWTKTKVWSEGGYCARVFFNVQGREPQGVISAGDYESFQNEMKLRLESLPGENGQPLKSLVFKPQEIYRNQHNVAPDLIVYLGELLSGDRSVRESGIQHFKSAKMIPAPILATTHSMAYSFLPRPIVSSVESMRARAFSTWLPL